MTETLHSALYPGRVGHHRHAPRDHVLGYTMTWALIDLGEARAGTLDGVLFKANRAAPFAFHERDHGDGGGDLDAWALARLADAEVTLDGGPLRILCMPRVLGYVFNPLSVILGYGPDGALRGIIYQVSNTFGERHSYVVPAVGGRVLRHAGGKTFYVSPFITMAAAYRFAFTPPAQDRSDTRLVIRVKEAERRLLDAWFVGARQPWGQAAWAATMLRQPALTLKVIGGIHWEALLLWRKRVPLAPRPLPPTTPATLLRSLTEESRP